MGSCGCLIGCIYLLGSLFSAYSSLDRYLQLYLCGRNCMCLNQFFFQSWSFCMPIVSICMILSVSVCLCRSAYKYPCTCYIHRYTFTDAEMYTYMGTYIHTCIYTYMYTYMYTYIHTYIHVYIHTCIHKYIHFTCKHTYIIHV